MTEPAVSVADIEAAERVLAITYTARERELMIGNIEGQIASSRLRRAKPIANSVPMASRFDPRLPNFRMPGPLCLLRLRTPAPASLPGDDEDIAFAPVTQLAAWIAAGLLSSRRLTEIYLARIQALNPKLECYAMVTADLARAEADRRRRAASAEVSTSGAPRHTLWHQGSVRHQGDSSPAGCRALSRSGPGHGRYHRAIVACRRRGAAR